MKYEKASSWCIDTTNIKKGNSLTLQSQISNLIGGERGAFQRGIDSPFEIRVSRRIRIVYIYGNILATENQQVRINDVIEVKNGVYLHKT